MGLPSGTFSHPDAGRLRVVFNGKWWVNSTDPTFAYGSWELILRAYVGSGANRATAIMAVANNTAVIEMEYPGGYATVPVGMEYVSHHLAGAGTIAAYLLSISCHLLRDA